MKRIFQLVIFILGGFEFVSGQTLLPPTNLSPNASSLKIDLETSVNLYNGIPSISVPVHTVKCGPLTLPITLTYNPTSVKPSEIPGWVGSGWNLQCAGVISRTKHGIVDERYVTNDATALNVTVIRPYYPFPTPNPYPAGMQYGSDYANLPYTSWGTNSQLGFDFAFNQVTWMDPTNGGQTTVLSPTMDPEADEFNFNVMGHTGKFYYEGPVNGWKVVSDENIKVEMTDFFTPTEVVMGIDEHVNASAYQGCYNLSPSLAYQSRMFGSFTLTMPDGTKYIFGGRKSYTPPGGLSNYNVPDGVEMTSPRGLASSYNSGDLIFEINAWYLKKIIDPNGYVINFGYKKTYPTTKKFYAVDYHSGTGVALDGSGYANFSGGADYNKYVLGEEMQWPQYLSKIETPTEIVNFKFSTVVADRYTTKQLSYANFSDNPAENNPTALEGVLLGSMTCSPSWPDYLNNIQWEKLDSIIVTDNPYPVALYQNQPVVTNKYAFNYSNSTAQRLMLGSFQKLGRGTSTIENYQFSYNTDFVTQSPGLHADGNYSDHWGYYNGTDLITYGGGNNPSSDFSSIPWARTANPSVSTSELLNKIIYPTGGATKFVWEPNDYAQIVSIDRQSLVPVSPSTTMYGFNGTGGGNRIAEISNIASDGTILTSKKYIYKSGYTNGSNPANLSSSGVLNGMPVYTFGFNNISGQFGLFRFSGTTHFFYGNGNYGYSGSGVPVGYKEVTEVNLDGSYSTHKFTSYDQDINGISHWDRSVVGALGWVGSTDANYTYFPMSELELERGKLLASYSYKADNTLLQKTELQYRSDAGRFDSYINIIEKRNEFFSDQILLGDYEGSVPPDRILFASARKVFTYTYYPSVKTTTTYDQNGNNPVVETENYAYNNNTKLLLNKTIVNSKGNTLSSNYLYPSDLGTPPYTSMLASHVLSSIIQATTTNNQNPVSQVTTNYTQVATNVYAPQNIQIKVGNNSAEIRDQVNLFDSHGNPLEVQKPGGVLESYIWGVNSCQILAKITGASYNSAIALVDPIKLNQAGFSFNINADDALRIELNKLRTGLPNALVTTYTYAVGLGITSETDPNGRTIYYEYDAFNRLVLIRDQDKKILKKICYNYAGQPESCNFIGNQTISQTFTRNNCATDYAGTIGTYTVPANTYFSSSTQQDADAQAWTDINQNGQNYVNPNPASGASCIPMVKEINTTSIPYTVTLTNTSTGAVSICTAQPSSTAVQIGQVTAGTYTITLTPYSTNTAQITINGVTQTGGTITFSGVSISTPLTITISPYSGGSCSFSMMGGYTSPTNSVSSSGGVASFYITFYSSSTMQVNTSYTIATINGSCKPSATRTLTYTTGGRTWSITITPGGQMIWKITSGAALNANTTVSTSTLTYNL